MEEERGGAVEEAAANMREINASSCFILCASRAVIVAMIALMLYAALFEELL